MAETKVQTTMVGVTKVSIDASNPKDVRLLTDSPIDVATASQRASNPTTDPKTGAALQPKSWHVVPYVGSAALGLGLAFPDGSVRPTKFTLMLSCPSDTPRGV